MDEGIYWQKATFIIPDRGFDYFGLIGITARILAAQATASNALARAKPAVAAAKLQVYKL